MELEHYSIQPTIAISFISDMMVNACERIASVFFLRFS